MSNETIHKDSCLQDIDTEWGDEQAGWSERLAKHNGDVKKAGEASSKDWHGRYQDMEDNQRKGHPICASSWRGRDFCWQSKMRLANSVERRLHLLFVTAFLLFNGPSRPVELESLAKPAPQTTFDAAIKAIRRGETDEPHYPVFVQACFGAVPRFFLQTLTGLVVLCAAPCETLIAPARALEKELRAGAWRDEAGKGVRSKFNYDDLGDAFLDKYRIFGPLDTVQVAEHVAGCLGEVDEVPPDPSNPIFPFTVNELHADKHKQLENIKRLLTVAANTPPPAIAAAARAHATNNPTKVVRNVMEGGSPASVVVTPLPLVSLVEVMRAVTLHHERPRAATADALRRLLHLAPAAANGPINDAAAARERLERLNRAVDALECYADACAHPDQPPPDDHAFSKILCAKQGVVDLIGDLLLVYEMLRGAHAPALAARGATVKGGGGGRGRGGRGHGGGSSGDTAATALLRQALEAMTCPQHGRSGSTPLAHWSSAATLERAPPILLLLADAPAWCVRSEDMVVVGSSTGKRLCCRVTGGAGSVTRHAWGGGAVAGVNSGGLDAFFVWSRAGSGGGGGGGGGDAAGSDSDEDGDEDGGGGGTAAASRGYVAVGNMQLVGPLGKGSSVSEITHAELGGHFGAFPIDGASSSSPPAALVQRARGACLGGRVETYLARRAVDLVLNINNALAVALLVLEGGANLLDVCWSVNVMEQVGGDSRRAWASVRRPSLQRQREASAAAGDGGVAAERLEAAIAKAVEVVGSEEAAVKAVDSFLAAIRRKLDVPGLPPEPTHDLVVPDGVQASGNGRYRADTTGQFVPVTCDSNRRSFAYPALAKMMSEDRCFLLFVDAKEGKKKKEEKKKEGGEEGRKSVVPFFGVPSHQCGNSYRFAPHLACGVRAEELLHANSYVMPVPLDEIGGVLTALDFDDDLIAGVMLKVEHGTLEARAGDEGGGGGEDSGSEDDEVGGGGSGDGGAGGRGAPKGFAGILLYGLNEKDVEDAGFKSKKRKRTTI